MRYSDIEKNKQLSSLLFILKLLSIFFSVIPLFQKMFSGMMKINQFRYNLLLTSILSLAVLGFLLILLMLIYHNSQKRDRRLLWLELPLFLLLSIGAIGLSGWNMSYYKFLFIFIIVSYTIEYSMEVGLAVSAVSSLIIVCIDLVSGNAREINTYFENDLALIAMFISIAVTVGLYSRIENQHIAHWKHYANIDGLTEIFNHRYFHQELQMLCEKSCSQNESISLIMLDIDYFKTYNDTYGYQRGDWVLKELVHVLEKRLGEKQIFCRYGGETFGIILPNTSLNEAVDLADRLRSCVEEYPFEGRDCFPSQKLTISVGVATLAATLNDEKGSFQDLIHQATTALNRAKYLRRNRVEIFASIIDEFHQQNPEEDTNPEVLQTLRTLIAVIDARDSYTYQHIERVVTYCSVMAEYLHLDSHEKRNLLYAAYLHDLGKINVEKDVLISTKKLTDEEWNQLKEHPVDGAAIIGKIEGFEEIAPIVLQHHERYGGGGYPHNLKGEQIQYLARILTLADSFDAMTNSRPYNRKRTFEQAFEEIRLCKNTQFDPELAEQFITALQNISPIDKYCTLENGLDNAYYVYK